MEENGKTQETFDECVKDIGIHSLKQICLLLKIRGASCLRKGEVAEKIKTALLDPAYMENLKKDYPLDNNSDSPYYWVYGKRLMRLENALKRAELYFPVAYQGAR